MWELHYKESWALANWCFWTVVLERTLESPLDSKVIQPVLPKGNLMLKLQHFGHLMQRADSFEKTLIVERLRAGREGNDRGWDGWMASLTRWTWVWVDSGSCWWTGRPGVLWFMGLQRVGWLSNWTEPKYVCYSFSSTEQSSFNFMAPVIINSDFGAQ